MHVAKHLKRTALVLVLMNSLVRGAASHQLFSRQALLEVSYGIARGEQE